MSVQKASFQLRIEAPLKAVVEEMAAKEDRSLNWMINNLLKNAVAQKTQAQGVAA